MESLREWREYKSRQRNERMCGEIRISSPRKNNSLFDIPMPLRSVVIARIRLVELQKREKSVKTQEQYENYRCDVSLWFSWLKNTMKEYKLSKEYLAENGLSWDACKMMGYGK